MAKKTYEGQVSLKTNLIQQNCYVRICAPCVDLNTQQSEKFYESMEEITEGDCLRHVKSTVPYEITSDYVNSFADSADFRNDPMNAIVNSVPRQGLGDVREFQKINEMDDTQAALLYKQLQERFSKAQNDAVKAQNEAAKAQTQINNSNSEVD